MKKERGRGGGGGNSLAFNPPCTARIVRFAYGAEMVLTEQCMAVIYLLLYWE